MSWLEMFGFLGIVFIVGILVVSVTLDLDRANRYRDQLQQLPV